MFSLLNTSLSCSHIPVGDAQGYWNCPGLIFLKYLLTYYYWFIFASVLAWRSLAITWGLLALRQEIIIFIFFVGLFLCYLFGVYRSPWLLLPDWLGERDRDAGRGRGEGNERGGGGGGGRGLWMRVCVGAFVCVVVYRMCVCLILFTCAGGRRFHTSG